MKNVLIRYTRVLAGALALAILFSSCAQPTAGDGGAAGAAATDTSSGTNTSDGTVITGTASLQMMNILAHGDEIERKVLDRYSAVSGIFDDAEGYLLKVMAINNLFPVIDEIEGFEVSLLTNYATYFENTDELLAAAESLVDVPSQSEMVEFCKTTANRVSGITNNIEKVKDKFDEAMGYIDTAVSVVNNLSNFVDYAVNHLGSQISSLVDTVSNLYSSIANIGLSLKPVSSFMSCLNGISKMSGGFFSLANSVFNAFAPSGSDARIMESLKQIIGRLDAIEKSLDDLKNRMNALSLQMYTQELETTLDSLRNLRSTFSATAPLLLNEETDRADTCLMQMATEIHLKIDGMVATYIRVAMNAQTQYFKQLAEYKGTDATSIAARDKVWGPISISLVGNFDAPYETYGSYEWRYELPYDEGFQYGEWKGGGAFTYPELKLSVNPDAYLPTTLECVDFLNEIILFRLSLIDLIFEKVENQEYCKSLFANKYLTDISYIPLLRNALNVSAANLESSFDTNVTKIDTYKSTCESYYQIVLNNHGTNNFAVDLDPQPSRKDGVQVRMNGETSSLTVPYSQPVEVVAAMKNAVRAEYFERSSSLMEYAGRLAALEMLLETYVGSTD